MFNVLVLLWVPSKIPSYCVCCHHLYINLLLVNDGEFGLEHINHQ